MAENQKKYDWAQAVVSLMSASTSDLNELAAAADLDPKNGDLVDIDLSDLDLSGQNLSGWDLRNANLKNARLTGTELRHATVDPWELVQAVEWEQANLDEELREVASTLIPQLTTNVQELEWSVRTANCLREIPLVGDLVQKTEAEMLRIPNFGRKSLNEVKELLAQMGLNLGMELRGWPPNRVKARRQLSFAHQHFVPTDWDIERQHVESLPPRARGLLSQKVASLRLQAATVAKLNATGIGLVAALVRRTEADLLRVPNFGRKSLNEIKEALALEGLHLGMEIPTD